MSGENPDTDEYPETLYAVADSEDDDEHLKRLKPQPRPWFAVAGDDHIGFSIAGRGVTDGTPRVIACGSSDDLDRILADGYGRDIRENLTEPEEEEA